MNPAASVYERLPAWVTWQHRPFPDANLLLLRGREPALVDSGFVGHVQQTADWVRGHSGQVTVVVNTHWHSDHVGGSAATGRRRRHRSQRAGRRSREPARPGLLPSRIPRPACRSLHRRPAAARRADPSARRRRLAGHPHAQAHPRPPVAMATRRAAACRLRRAVGLRRRLGQPRPRWPGRRGHRTRLTALTRRAQPARAASGARADPHRPRPRSPPRYAAPSASLTTRPAPSGTPPGASSRSR